MSALTKPAPPAQSKPRRDIEEPLELQLHVPNNMTCFLLAAAILWTQGYNRQELWKSILRRNVPFARN
jgi:hypothetical protein